MNSSQEQFQKSLSLRLADEGQTAELAGQFALLLTKLRDAIRQGGFNIRLTGDLGAGKTTFTRALLRKLGVTSRIKSPTFELEADYDILDGISFHHFDFYRFESPIEFEEAGFRDLFGPGSVTACEWSEKAAGFLPDADIEMTISVEGFARTITIRSFSENGDKILCGLQP